MKKICLLLALFLSSGVYAQGWCKPGAVWHYNYGGGMASAFAKVSYLKDTIINNQINNMLLVQKQGVRGSISNLHFFNEYYRLNTRKFNNVFYLGKDTMYSFNFAPGVSWRLPISGNYRCQGKVTAVDTGTLMRNGKSLKFLVVDVKKDIVVIRDSIIENIGYLYFYIFMPSDDCWNDCFPEYGGPLRCYSDNYFNYQNSSVNVSCDYYYSTGIEDQNLKNKLSVYPNPSQGKVNVNLPDAVYGGKLTITTLSGQLVLDKSLGYESEISFNLNDLKDGFYVINLCDNNGKILQKKPLLLQR